MKFSTSLLSTIALALGSVNAGPVLSQRALNDGQILNYALTLEHLEATFYAQGLANFTYADFQKANSNFTSTFYADLETIASDEKTHVSFLETALQGAGIQATEACTYSFPVTTPEEFVVVASILEGVGVSAYLGAAASIMEKAYLTAAGSILTVEARHSSFVRSWVGKRPFAQPFDTPLTINQVYSLAASFITGCPSTNPSLPVMAFPALAATPTGDAFTTGSEVLLATTAMAQETEYYAAFVTVTGPIFVPAWSAEDGYKTTIPEGVKGQSYIILTNNGTSVSDDSTVAGPAIVEVW